MVRVYAVALELPATYFDAMFEKPILVQRLTHYPARSAARASTALRLTQIAAS
jgi:isopenicillin N synthase-like dioxygenase